MGGRLSLVDCIRLGSGLGVPGAEGDGLCGTIGVGAPVSRSGLPGLCGEPNDSWRLVLFRSHSIVRRLAGGCTGTYFRRNLRL